MIFLPKNLKKVTLWLLIAAPLIGCKTSNKNSDVKDVAGPAGNVVHNPDEQTLMSIRKRIESRQWQLVKLESDILFGPVTTQELLNNYDFRRNCVYLAHILTPQNVRLKILYFTNQNTAAERCPLDGVGTTINLDIYIENDNLIGDFLTWKSLNNVGDGFITEDYVRAVNGRDRVGKWVNGKIHGLCTSETEHDCIILLKPEKTICAFVKIKLRKDEPFKYNKVREFCGLPPV